MRRTGTEPAAHHRLLMSKLVRVSRGTCPRLIITMPPGSAKSTYASVKFPPWYLNRHPDHSLLVCSHTDELADRWGRKVRNLIEEHGPALRLKLSTDNTAAGRWALQARPGLDPGEYYAAGVGTAIPGFRGDLVIIDDPVRNKEAADSPLQREKLWEWFKGDLRPRMKPGGRIILIMTRWHEDDIAGRLLAEMAKGGETWEVLCLPAEARENDPLGREPGEFLWDEDPSYPYGAFLRSEKITQTARNWSSLYQQEPAPEEGLLFKADWFKPYKTHPPLEELAIYGGSDYAVTDDGGDYTVHIVLGVDLNGRLYLLDLWRGQTASDIWVEQFCRLVKKWKPLDWAEETGQITSGVGPFLESEARRQKAYVNREQFPTRANKATRAQSIRGRMALDGLYVPEHAPWYADFRRELLSFPAGHDDQVDALGLVGQLLDRMIEGRSPPKKAEPKPKAGYSAKDTEGESFKVY